jgi:hypothetical protein
VAALQDLACMLHMLAFCTCWHQACVVTGICAERYRCVLFVTLWWQCPPCMYGGPGALWHRCFYVPRHDLCLGHSSGSSICIAWL